MKLYRHIEEMLHGVTITQGEARTFTWLTERIYDVKERKAAETAIYQSTEGKTNGSNIS